MQSTTYFPMYYPTSDLNIGSNGFSSHLFNSNSEFGEERGYVVSLPPSTMDQYSVYDKAVLRQLIQNHEATFRNQVRELHRLYQRQKELIDDMRVKQIFTRHLLSDTIHHSSQALPEISQTTSHSMSWLLGYIGSVKTQASSRHNLNNRKSNILIDLNEPVQLETCHMETMHDDQCHSRLLNYTTGGTNSSMAIDLNSLPDNCFSETGLDEKLLKVKAEIDLNISVVTDEPSPPTIDLVGPVSPENNECSPPRGESENTQIEIPLSLSDTLAARTLVMISISQNSLFWFAEIVSSTGDDLDNEIMKLENAVKVSRVFRQEKEMGTLSFKSRRGTCKKACPKQRKHGKLSTSDVIKKGANSALKMHVLMSWGKIKKRRGDRKRKASNNVFLFVC